MPSLASVTFDTSTLLPQSADPARKVWFTPAGDGISLNFFDKPPDLPPNLRSPDQLQQFYSSSLQGSPATLVETRLTTVAQCPAIRLILKSPQQPHGLTYVGSLTIPFRDFSYVLKVQCQELGPTGT